MLREEGPPLVLVFAKDIGPSGLRMFAPTAGGTR